MDTCWVSDGTVDTGARILGFSPLKGVLLISGQALNWHAYSDVSQMKGFASSPDILSFTH